MIKESATSMKLSGQSRMSIAKSPVLLVVEDDEEARIEFLDLFIAGGIETVGAGDGIEALVLNERHRSIRVILADIYMPRMDGLTFVSELQRLNGKSTKAPRLIFLSGRRTFTDAITALRLQAWDFLSKPTPPKALLERVRTALAEDDNDNSSETAEAAPTPKTYRELVSSLLAERKAAQRHVHAELFSDPCWDMLLELYATVLDGKQTSLTGLCFAAGVPLTTATRRLDDLVTAGLASKTYDAVDRRRVIVGLTIEGRSRLESFLKITNGHAIRPA
jgi:CheY-like chemotaxis protein